MFDQVHFTGNVNLGNIINVLVTFVIVVTAYIRLKNEQMKREAEKKIPGGRRKDDPPPPGPPPPPDKEVL